MSVNTFLKISKYAKIKQITKIKLKKEKNVGTPDYESSLGNAVVLLGIFSIRLFREVRDQYITLTILYLASFSYLRMLYDLLFSKTTNFHQASG